MANDPVNSLIVPVNHNPDVLSCLANLSNDEVFTPPSVANAMLDLLPQELFRNPDTKFLDPVCKSGVFLREITKRLMTGLEKEFPDRQKRLDHILHNQVYGIAITELTSLLSRRTLYCAKYATSPYAITKFASIDGNIRFKAIQHTWKNGKCVFCGASQSRYEREDGLETHAYEFIHRDNPQEIFGDMKFDVIIGNPPYQLNTGETSKQAIPLYDKFIDKALSLNPQYLTMIIPARWFAGGMGLSDFRSKMKECRGLNKIFFYPKSRDCFTGVDIAGGVCYFLIDKNSSSVTEFVTINNGRIDTRKRPLNEFDIIIGNNIGVDIIHKIKKNAVDFIDKFVLPISPFGLSTSARGDNQPFPEAITLISSQGKSYINRNDLVKNKDIIDKYKVIIGQLNPDRGGVNNSIDGKSNVITKIKILKPCEVPTATYLVINYFNNKLNAENFATYLLTKFARFLIFLTLSSMHIAKNNFQFVPVQDFSKPWTDAELYAKYNLSQEEIDYIESAIKPMELSPDAEAEARDA